MSFTLKSQPCKSRSLDTGRIRVCDTSTARHRSVILQCFPPVTVSTSLRSRQCVWEIRIRQHSMYLPVRLEGQSSKAQTPRYNTSH